jgi:glycosyltransferase involved in cell wall biosynthesis
MNVLINCSNLKIGGGLQVAHSFVCALLGYKDFNFTVVCSDALFSQVLHLDKAENMVVVNYNTAASVFSSLTGRSSLLDKLVIEHKITVVFSVFGPVYWRPAVKHITGYAKPHYIYTSSPFFNKLGLLNFIHLKVKGFFHMLDFKRNSDILITENEDVTLRLQQLLPSKKIYTVTNYYNQIFDATHLWDLSIQLPLFSGFTLLTIAANYPHKNLSIIPKVIKYLLETKPNLKVRFVLTLDKGALGGSLNSEIENCIVYLGKIEIAACPSLYLQSDAVFLPTLLECFTATYPEAMRMKKPLLTSDLNFARGLCNDAALYFDPLDHKDIANQIVKLITSRDLRDALIDAGTQQLTHYDTYDARAKKYIEIITQ